MRSTARASAVASSATVAAPSSTLRAGCVGWARGMNVCVRAGRGMGTANEEAVGANAAVHTRGAREQHNAPPPLSLEQRFPLGLAHAHGALSAALQWDGFGWVSLTGGESEEGACAATKTRCNKAWKPAEAHLLGILRPHARLVRRGALCVARIHLVKNCVCFFTRRGHPARMFAKHSQQNTPTPHSILWRPSRSNSTRRWRVPWARC